MLTFSHESCQECGAMCCRHLVIPIPKPESRKEMDKLKWQLYFDTIQIFIQDKQWHLLVDGKCRYLGPDDRCTRYDRRPKICRHYNPPGCEFSGAFYDVLFAKPEELEKYWKENHQSLAGAGY